MKYKIILAVIFVFFLVSRIYKIADIPKSVYWDEASIGYNAYSITTDFRDEWGKKFPLHFRAFGEFKLPVYIYSTAILVKMIGLNEYAVRLPAVLYSLGTLIVVYLLMKRITKNESISILSVFILTLSPWLFIFSRTGYEATSGLFFFMLGIYIFIFNPAKKWLFLIGTLSLIASMYSYTSYRIIVPLTLLGTGLIYLKSEFKKNIIVLVLSFIIFVISIIPIARLFIYDAGFGRASSFALIPGFQQVYDLAGKPHLQITFNRNGNINWWHNVSLIGSNYLSHFSPNFLFLKGDSNPRSQIPGHGQLYLFDIPFLILGLIAIIKSKKALFYLPLILLILSPIPASLTNESPHALRTLLAAPQFAIISAMGIVFLTDKFKKYSVIILCVVVICYCLSFEQYAFDFLTKYPNESASDWQYQYKEIFTNVSGNKPQTGGKVTDKYGQPYIFALYYLKYPPEKFRSEVQYNPVNNWGFSTVKSFNGFVFTDK